MNRTALITGGARRIGRAIGEHLASVGWNLIIHYRSSENQASELVDELSEKYADQFFYSVKADLSKPEEYKNLIAQVVYKYGNFGLLVNNASVFDPGYLRDTESEMLKKQFETNLFAPFMLTREFALVCKTGVIINVVDTRITNNTSNYSAYSLSKKGLWDLTQMAALELAPEIRVNAIAPGVTLAPENEGMEYLQKLAQEIPMKQVQGLDPILKSVDYILNNTQLTGQLLFADGGESLGPNT